MSYQNIKQRRPRTERDDSDCLFQHELAYTYKVRIHGEEVPICAKAFISLHGYYTWTTAHHSDQIIIWAVT